MIRAVSKTRNRIILLLPVGHDGDNRSCLLIGFVCATPYDPSNTMRSIAMRCKRSIYWLVVWALLSSCTVAQQPPPDSSPLQAAIPTSTLSPTLIDSSVPGTTD